VCRKLSVLVIIAMLCAVFTLSSIVQPAAATTGNCELDEAKISISDVTGMYGIAEIYPVSYTNNYFDQTEAWTTLIIADNNFDNIAEINVVAQWDWWRGWTFHCCFSHKNNGGTMTGDVTGLLSFSFGQEIQLCVGKYYSDNTWIAQYKIGTGSWQTISTYSYSTSWSGTAAESGLEILHPAVEGQMTQISSMTGILYQTNRYTWNNWSPNALYDVHNNQVQYNVGVHDAGYRSWSSQVRGYADVYAYAYHPEYGTLCPNLYVDNQYAATQPCTVQVSSGYHSFQTDYNDPWYGLPACTVWYNNYYVADGADSGSQYVPELGTVFVEFEYGNYW
jgi:hypothetical protein